MCEVYPGPRCSSHVNQKVNQRVKALEDARVKFGEGSHAYMLAKARLDNSVAEHDTTPIGLKRLRQQVEENPEDEGLRKRLYVAETTRRTQVNALKEIRNGRVGSLTTILTSLRDFHDEDEIESIIESSRNRVEFFKIRSKKMNANFSVNETRYKLFLENLEKGLLNKHGSLLPEGVVSALNQLKELEAPDGVSMEAYEYLPEALKQAYTHMGETIRTIAALQGVSPRIAAEYYEGYRKQYKEKFAHLPENERPDPPASWVRGEFFQSGFVNDPFTRFSPHDPASMYAVYRLRSDDNAIPDYVKTARLFASIDLETASPPSDVPIDKAAKQGRIIEVGVKTYNSAGKEISSFERLIKPEDEFLQKYGTGAEDVHKISVKDLEGKPDWRNVAPEVSSQLEGKVLLAQNVNFERSWLAEHLPDFDSKVLTVDTWEVSRKHFDLPNHKLQTICEHNNVAYTDGHRALHDADVAGNVYFQMRQTIRKQWASKPTRKNAPVLEGLPSNSRWSKKKA